MFEIRKAHAHRGAVCQDDLIPPSLEQHGFRQRGSNIYIQTPAFHLQCLRGGVQKLSPINRARLIRFVFKERKHIAYCGPRKQLGSNSQTCRRAGQYFRAHPCSVLTTRDACWGLAGVSAKALGLDGM